MAGPNSLQYEQIYNANEFSCTFKMILRYGNEILPQSWQDNDIAG